MILTMEVYAEAEDLYPKQANPTDAGFDLYSAEDVDFLPGVRKWVRTGVALRPSLEPVNYPDCTNSILQYDKIIRSHQEFPLWDIQVRARGSMWGRGFNTHLGTGDGTFNCEYRVGLEWTGTERAFIARGERIAQLVFHLSMTGYEVQFIKSEQPFPKVRGWHGSSGK